jgi:hypothetical protein
VIYAALAGVLLSLGLAVVWAVWDLGRRWLVTKERATEAALIRVNEKWGDLQSTLNLRVRELSDRLDAHEDLIDGESRAGLDTSNQVKVLRKSIDHVAEAIAKQPAESESADVAELIRKIETQEKAIANFWHLVGQQFASKDELKTEVDKIKGAQAVLSATGTSTFRRRA